MYNSEWYCLLQQAQQFRQNSESMPSPSSPGSPAVRSPDSAVSHGDTMFALSPASHSSLNTQFTDQVKMVRITVTGMDYVQNPVIVVKNSSDYVLSLFFYFIRMLGHLSSWDEKHSSVIIIWRARTE